MKTIIYDAEIISMIPDRKSPNIPGLKYCQGWNDHANMGISVICAYDYFEKRYRVFLEDNFDEFQELVNRSTCVVGFNSISFDDSLMKANGLFVNTTYDLLCETRIASGQPAAFTPGKTRGGYGLEDISLANLGKGKTGHGEHAPKLWQEGKRGQVIDYCMEDVRLTKKLFEMSQKHTLKDPTTGQYLVLRSLMDVWDSKRDKTAQRSLNL